MQPSSPPITMAGGSMATPPVTVVVADGDADARRQVAALLAGQGCAVVEVEDGLAALREVRALQPPLVVLDAYLSGLDGLTVCRAITRDPALAGTAVVVLTSDPTIVARQGLLGVGAAAYLLKPVASAKFLGLVRERVTGAAPVQGGEPPPSLVSTAQARTGACAVETSAAEDGERARPEVAGAAAAAPVAAMAAVGSLPGGPGSPDAFQGVLDAIVVTAAQLGHAADATLLHLHGQLLRLAAHTGPVPSPAPGAMVPLARASAAGRAVLERRTCYVPDILAPAATEYPLCVELAQRAGAFRAVLAVPLLGAGGPAGVIVLRAAEPGSFVEPDIQRLEAFAEVTASGLVAARLL